MSLCEYHRDTFTTPARQWHASGATRCNSVLVATHDSVMRLPSASQSRLSQVAAKDLASGVQETMPVTELVARLTGELPRG